MKKLVLKTSGVAFLSVLLLSSTSTSFSAMSFWEYQQNLMKQSIANALKENNKYPFDTSTPNGQYYPPLMTHPNYKQGQLVPWNGQFLAPWIVNKKYDIMINALETSKRTPDGPNGSAIKWQVTGFGQFPKQDLRGTARRIVDLYGGILVFDEILRSEPTVGFQSFINAGKRLGMTDWEARTVAIEIRNKDY